MKTEAVILDWAGTTVDYGCFAPVQAFIDAFAAKNIEVTLEEVRKPMGMLKRDHIKVMLEMPRIKALYEAQYGPATEEVVDEMLEIFTKQLMEVLENDTQLKPFALDTFNLLKEKGIKIGSTTGFTRAMLQPVQEAAEKLGYKPEFSVTPDEVNNFGRPYPYMIFENLRALQVEDVRNVIKVGDTVSDVLEAKHAGVRAFAVLEGSSEMGLSESEYEALSEAEKAERLEKARSNFVAAGAEQVLLNLSELEQYL